MGELKTLSSSKNNQDAARLRIPSWMRRPLSSDKTFFTTSALINSLKLNTVCQAAKCPNRHECYTSGTATFLILGENCTRNCRFCNIHPGQIFPPDPQEPGRVAEAARTLKLRHVVITSVTRDDLPDGGAKHFAETVKAVREARPQSTIEVLIPDFQGNEEALLTVFQAGPDVINHNVETHPRLYPAVRPQASYAQSLELLSRVKRLGQKRLDGGAGRK
jgi:Lipoate synthase